MYGVCRLRAGVSISLSACRSPSVGSICLSVRPASRTNTNTSTDSMDSGVLSDHRPRTIFSQGEREREVHAAGSNPDPTKDMSQEPATIRGDQNQQETWEKLGETGRAWQDKALVHVETGLPR